MLSRIVTVLTAVGISLAAILMVAPATVLAYPPCASSSTASVSSPTVAPGGNVTFTVTIKDCNGGAVAGSMVAFTSTGPGTGKASFNPATAATDANGQLSTIATFPAGFPGMFMLAGATQGITVTAAVRETGGFPLTSTSPAADRALPPLTAILMLMLGLLLVAGGGARALHQRR